VDPIQYKNDPKCVKADWEEFNKIALKARKMHEGCDDNGIIQRIMPDQNMKREGFENVVACQFAYSFHKQTHIMLCTSYNLVKCLQMFDFNYKTWPQAAAQLLLWIQDRLDDLKNMPENPEKEEEYCAGEAQIRIDGKLEATRDMMFTESDLILHEQRGAN
jgi:hypothetical protein